jgi:hypothetical protein
MFSITTSRQTSSRRGGQFYSIALTVATRVLSISLILFGVIRPATSLADVPTGSEDKAKIYYARIADEIGFSTSDAIFQSTLDDVASYLGYSGLTGADMQNLPASFLMSPEQMLGITSVGSGNALQHFDLFAASQTPIPFRSGDILVTRFFAPKIMNIKDPETTRQWGWRKLVRLKSRAGSAAQAHQISEGIILFNYFTPPGVPVGLTNESVNTQVMLVTTTDAVPAPNDPGPDSLYWLDYDTLSSGGKLSLALNAFFDANELPQSTNGKRPYFVPDGCVACHGDNPRRSMVNYLDTDHWFDRLDNDFQSVKASGTALLVDAQTNDTNAAAYRIAFDLIRQFNVEADAQVQKSQPKHDETLAAQKWIVLHASSNAHVLPVDRAIGADPQWASTNSDDVQVLGDLNQYCFRCHGTVKFSVFDRQKMHTLDSQVKVEFRIRTNAPPEAKMPPDRDLPDDVRGRILHNIVP